MKKGASKKKKYQPDAIAAPKQPASVRIERADGGFVINDYLTGKTSVATNEADMIKQAKKRLKIG